MSKKEWKEFEELVHKIQTDLSPTATVTHNSKLRGMDSKKQRQIDVLIEQNIGQHSIKIIVECKDFKKKIGLHYLEAFVQKKIDVRASKGVFVSARGFTKPAKNMASQHDIDIYEVVDAGKHNWTRYIGIYAAAEYTKPDGIKFSLRGEPFVNSLNLDRPQEIEIFDWKLDPLGNLVSYFFKAWNRAAVPQDAGEHNGILLTPFAKARIRNGDEHLEYDIYCDYSVSPEFYFGLIPVINARGFWDLRQEALIFSKDSTLQTAWIDRFNVHKGWEKIKSIEAAPNKPLIIFKGISIYDPENLGL